MKYVKKEELQDRPLIVEVKNRAYNKDGSLRGAYVDVQLDTSLYNPETVRETGADKDGNPITVGNPHLTSIRKERGDGKGMYTDHTVFYQASQLDGLLKAAQSSKIDKVVRDEKGEVKVMGVQASLVPCTQKIDGKNTTVGLVIDTSKPMSATRNPQFGKNTLEKQQAVHDALNDFKQKERQANAPEQTASAEVSPEVAKEASEPSFG